MVEKLALALFIVAIVFAATGTSPFAPRQEIVDRTGGNLIIQLFWVSLAGITSGLGVLRDPRGALRLALRAWPALLVLAWLFASMTWAAYPDLTLRRTMRLMLVAMTAYGLALNMPRPELFFRALLISTGAVMVVNVLGVFAIPHLATTSSGWLGLHPHKNTAGQFVVIAVLAWIVGAAMVRDLRLRTIVFCGALVWFGFLVMTQSKTAIGLAAVTPLVLIVGNAIMRTERLMSWTLAALVAAAGTGLWFFFMAIGWGWADLGLAIFNDLTFTGRTGLWEFLWGEVEQRPIFGIGFGSFWQTGERLSPLDFARGWAATTTQGHNGYLDLWLQVGVIGLGLAIFAVLRVLVDAVRLVGRPNIGAETQGAYLMAVAFLVALLLLNMMESTLFRSDGFLSAVFLFTYFMVARWTLESPEAPARGAT